MNHLEAQKIRHAPTMPPSREAGDKVLLRVEGLGKAFGGQVVLEDLSLELRRGEVVLLRGDNGSGKTTLLNILTGNLEPDAGAIQFFTNGVEEAFHFPKRWWQNLNPFDHFAPERVSREGVGRTWQEIRLFTSQNLRDNIALASPDQLGENPAWALFRRSAVKAQERNIRSAAEIALAKLGLKGRETSSADRVSLGQSKRVAIARAVQAGARILFLDEPLAGLDAPGIAEVMRLLENLARQEQVTLVIVEHIFNIPRILDLATTVWTLEGGKVTVQTPADVRTEMTHATGDGIQGWIRALTGPTGNIKVQELPGGAVLSTMTPAGTHPGDVVLEVEGLVVHRGRRLVIGEQEPSGKLRGLTFCLHKGQLAVLQAPNGWGKTTLLEAIAGVLPMTRGTIRLNGQPVENLLPYERARLGMSLLQARNHTFPGLTVREALRLSHVTDVPENIRHLLGRRMSDLSGGEKQKVAITSALRSPAVILLLDEPFSALDSTGLKDIWKTVKQEGDVASLIAVPSNVQGGLT